MTTKPKAKRYIACSVETFIDKQTGEERKKFHECGVVWAREKVINIKLTTLPIGGVLVCFLPKSKPTEEPEPERATTRGVGRRG